MEHHAKITKEMKSHERSPLCFLPDRKSPKWSQINTTPEDEIKGFTQRSPSALGLWATLLKESKIQLTHSFSICSPSIYWTPTVCQALHRPWNTEMNRVQPLPSRSYLSTEVHTVLMPLPTHLVQRWTREAPTSFQDAQVSTKEEFHSIHLSLLNLNDYNFLMK